ncbi:MAG: sporulation membrane protein YtaF [Bacilli bacterium]
MKLLSLLILAFAVSLDGFGVGVTYGLRKIRIPLWSVATIALCSALVMTVSMQIGLGISQFISPLVAKWVGAVILIAIGIWALVNVTKQKNHDPVMEPVSTLRQERAKIKYEWIRIKIKTLGLIVQILRTPSAADIDKSGTITGKEAALLGLALSLDAFGAGIGAALIGYNPWISSVVIALMCIVFIVLGL